MREVIQIELRRILSPRVFAIIMATVLLYSIYTSINCFSGYNLYDGRGVVQITARENIQLSKHHTSWLNERTLQEVVDRRDTSQALYNSSLVLMVARNYDKKITELTKQDIQNFYRNRVEKLIEETKMQTEMRHLPPLSKEKNSYLERQGKQMEQPLLLGYKEGWKSLNSDMGQIGVLALFLSSFLVLPIFAQNPKTRMKELCMSTQKGKMLHYKARIAAGVLTALLVYIPSLSIFVIIRLIILGFQGGKLPIQSSVTYFFSAWNVTYVQQFLINCTLGLLAVLLITVFVLLCGAALEQLISTGAVVSFFWIFMLVAQSTKLMHYIYCFFPYNMMNFTPLYLDNDTYSILGIILPSYIWIIFVGVGIFLMLLGLLFFTAKYKVALNRCCAKRSIL